MTKTFLVSLLFTALSCSGQERPLRESCERYQMDISQELALWEKAPLLGDVFQAVSSRMTDFLHIGKKIEMPLISQENVKFVVSPEKSFVDSQKAFAGLAFVSVPKSGVYRFFSGSRIWFDVVDAGSKTLLTSTGHQMDGRCPMRKVVTFLLNKNQNYILQISSSTENKVFILITRD